MQHYTSLRNNTQHYTTLHNITQHYTTLHNITQHYATLHHITQQYTTLHNITQHCTTCMHASIRTYIHTYLHTCIHTYLHTYIHTCMHACIHTYLQCIYIVYRIICIRYRTIIRHPYHLFTSQNEIPKQSVQIISNNNAQHPKFDMVAQFGISISRTRTIFIPQHPAPLNSL